MKIFELLEIKKGVTAVIGGGGKTSLIHALAEELQSLGSVLLCTTTRIFPPFQFPVLLSPSAEDINKALQKGPVCIGTLMQDGKLGEPGIPMKKLEELADFILVEADGSAGKPLKAHLPHEPVIPPDANQVILVAGISGLGKPVLEAAHRPELFAAIAKADIHDLVTPEMAADVILFENLHTRVFLNQVDKAKAEEEEEQQQYKLACRIAGRLHCPVAAGSLQKGIYYDCTDSGSR